MLLESRPKQHSDSEHLLTEHSIPLQDHVIHPEHILRGINKGWIHIHIIEIVISKIIIIIERHL